MNQDDDHRRRDDDEEWDPVDKAAADKGERQVGIDDRLIPAE
jgi:hypothetical protein